MQHQDWNTVVIHGAQAPGTKIKKPKQAPGLSNAQKNIRGDDPDAPERVSHDLSQQIQDARAVAGLKQAELAHRINVKAEVIRAYENGTAIPSPAILNNLRRVLNAKLTS